MCKSKQSVGAALLAGLLVFAAGVARGQVACETCPANAQAPAIAAGISVFDAATQLPVTGETVGACQQLIVVADVGYRATVQSPSGPLVGAGFTGGTGRILVEGAAPGTDVTPDDMSTTKL